MKYPTIVTALYNINSKYKSIDKYIELANKFLFTLPYPIIIYTDNDEILRQYIKPNICIYQINFNDTYYYKYYDDLCKLQKQFVIKNVNPIKDTISYFILTYNKFFFIENAISNNPFMSSHFIWIDFGINHVALQLKNIHNIMNNIPDKIKQLCINPYLENTLPKEYFEYLYHSFAGGLFSGSIHYLSLYCSQFKNKLNHIIKIEKWYTLEQEISCLIYRDSPHLFDLYFGDFQDIISNYIKPVNGFDIMYSVLKKSLTYNNIMLTYHLCNYLDLYYDSNFYNKVNDLFFYYIYSNILCNYYCNNKKLKTNIITMITPFSLKNGTVI